MPFIPTLACVQARLIWQEDNGAQAQNVFYHATAGVPLMSDLESIGEAWGSLFTEYLVTNTSPAWNLLGVALRAMNEEEGLVLFFDDGMPIAGTNTGGQLPDQVCYTVTWSTGMSGRSARGRTYAIGVTLAAITGNNRLADASRTEYNNAWNNIREGFETDAHALQVVSFVDEGVPREEGRKLPILSGSVRFPLATQRRRLS